MKTTLSEKNAALNFAASTQSNSIIEEFKSRVEETRKRELAGDVIVIPGHYSEKVGTTVYREFTNSKVTHKGFYTLVQKSKKRGWAAHTVFQRHEDNWNLMLQMEGLLPEGYDVELAPYIL